MGIVKVKLDKEDLDNLAKALRSMNEIRFNAVVKKNVNGPSFFRRAVHGAVGGPGYVYCGRMRGTALGL